MTGIFESKRTGDRPDKTENNRPVKQMAKNEESAKPAGRDAENQRSKKAETRSDKAHIYHPFDGIF